MATAGGVFSTAYLRIFAVPARFRGGRIEFIALEEGWGDKVGGETCRISEDDEPGNSLVQLNLQTDHDPDPYVPEGQVQVCGVSFIHSLYCRRVILFSQMF